MPSSSKSNIYFFFDGVNASLKNRNKLKRFIEYIFRNENRTLEQLNFVFCTDQKLLELNNKYLSHNTYTDILTFDISEKEDKVVAEVYISVDRVKENANNFKTTFSEELHRVIFHGVLHLCGYHDQTSSQIKKIRNKESLYLNKYRT